MSGRFTWYLVECFLKSNKVISLLLIAIGLFCTVKVNAGGDAAHI